MIGRRINSGLDASVIRCRVHRLIVSADDAARLFDINKSISFGSDICATLRPIADGRFYVRRTPVVRGNKLNDYFSCFRLSAADSARLPRR